MTNHLTVNPQALSNREQIKLRNRLIKRMEGIVDIALDAIEGRRELSTNQVKLIGLLMDRTIPKAMEAQQIDVTHRAVVDLTREELLTIAGDIPTGNNEKAEKANKNKKIVDGEFEEID